MEENSIDAGNKPAAGKEEKKKKKQQLKVEEVDKGAGFFNGCFSFGETEIPIDPGVKSLKQLDSKKFKEEIIKWAKRVASYARQLSDHFGSSRR